MMLQDIAPHAFHIEYQHKKPADTDYVLCFRSNEILLQLIDENTFTFPTVADLLQQNELTYSTELRYLFSIDEHAFYMPLIYHDIRAYREYYYKNIRDLRHMKPMWKAFAAVNGFRLFTWYENNRFCGKCGMKMNHSETERALKCPSCGQVLYPIISPSVIVAVRNGNRLLLTRYQASHSPSRNYALVAGYIETGETAEDAVRREVMEEVGLKVKNIRYYKSQPWPFSGALLFGFFCDLDGDDTITLELDELQEGVWMERGNLPDRSSDISLTSEMMEQFRLGHQ